VATKEAPSSAPLPSDIRRSRPYLLSSSPLRHFALRLGSVLALVVLDLGAVGFGL
jgi:hypothetical protein